MAIHLARSLLRRYPALRSTWPLQQASAWRRERNLNYRIGVDGGIDFTTAAECAQAGADTFISGTGLFKHRNLAAAVRKMRKAVETSQSDAQSSEAIQRPLQRM